MLISLEKANSKLDQIKHISFSALCSFMFSVTFPLENFNAST